jgi:hypothetical protein
MIVKPVVVVDDPKINHAPEKIKIKSERSFFFIDRVRPSL